MSRLALTALLLMAACVTAEQMFVPMDTEVRPAKPVASVVLLEGEPYLFTGLDERGGKVDS